ncbi:MAG: hypothetical protein LBS35_00055 [Synergistaceae bacterium]|nr:hypothetical protein [Synergistaceae bacterium]
MFSDERLLKLLALIRAQDVDFDAALVGGMAVVAHGVRRGTIDYDFLVDTPNFIQFQAAVKRLAAEGDGFVPGLEDIGRLTVTSHHEASPGSEDNLKNAAVAVSSETGEKFIDFLSVYYAYEKEGIERSHTIPGMEPLKLLDIPYLVLMKMKAMGPKDIADIVMLYHISPESKKSEILDITKRYGTAGKLTKLLERFTKWESEYD